MWVPEVGYDSMSIPLPEEVNGDLEGYLQEQEACGTGEVEKVACVLTDPIGTQRSLGYTCQEAMDITSCGSECPTFEYKVDIS